MTKAEKESELAEKKQNSDETASQLKTDDTFLKDTKSACKEKATQWASRTRLRTEEIQGIIEGISILSSDSASATFKDSATTFFLQTNSSDKESRLRDSVWKRLKAVAKKAGSLSLAKLAADVRMGGHFDKVIAAIDTMIGVLREEEADDIAHRDRCEGSQTKNENDLADKAHNIEKAKNEAERLDAIATELKMQIDMLKGEISDAKTDQETLLKTRNKAVADFKKALKDDTDAVALIADAIVALSKFYKKNQIPLELAQKKSDPEYTVDARKAPDTTWTDGAYGGRKGESGGILAILSMIKEDLEMEIKTGREEDAEAEASYEKMRGALQDTINAREKTQAETEAALAETNAKIEDETETKEKNEKEEGAQEELKSSLETDCAWVATHFNTRRDKRKTEMEGLVDAKNYLAGVEAGDEI